MGCGRQGSFSPAGILLPVITGMWPLPRATCSKGMWPFIHSNRLGLVERQENFTEKNNNQETEAKSSNNVVNAADCKSRQGTRTARFCKPLKPLKGLTRVEESQPSSGVLPKWINTPVCLKEPLQTTVLDLQSCLLLIQLQWWKIVGLPPIMIQAEGWKDATYKSHHRSHNFCEDHILLQLSRGWFVSIEGYW